MKTQKMFGRLFSTLFALTCIIAITSPISARFVQKGAVTYNWGISRLSDTQASGYVSSSNSAEYLKIDLRSWAFKGTTLQQRDSSATNPGDGYAHTINNHSSGYFISQIKGTYFYAGTSKSETITYP